MSKINSSLRKLSGLLVHRILPCQHRDFNLWEFDPAQHQTLSRLFDMTYEDVWKVRTKGAEAPTSAPRTADTARGVTLAR